MTLLIYANLEFQCKQTFDIFVRDNKLINNENAQKYSFRKYDVALMKLDFVPVSSEKYYIFSQSTIFFITFGQ